MTNEAQRSHASDSADLLGRIGRLIFCRILDKPRQPKLLKQGTYLGRGDYGDEWGMCSRCGHLTHRDMHMFGDGIWRHAA